MLHEVDPNRFRFDWHSAEFSGMTFVRYDLSAEIRSTAEPVDQLLACRVSGSDAQVRSDTDDLDARHPWFTDGARVHARWGESARVSALIFDRATLEAYARRTTGDDRLSLRVTELSPRTPTAGNAWNRMFSYLEDTIDADDADTPAVRAELQRHAFALTLATFPTTMDDSLRAPAQTRPAPVTVRRALTYIAENAHRPITVDDVAEAVHISTRGLQYAFRRSLDLTPTEALRRARMDGAHRELQSTERSTIAEIARRWGYAHPSRFAAAYRAEFGVPPSVTATRR